MGVTETGFWAPQLPAPSSQLLTNVSVTLLVRANCSAPISRRWRARQRAVLRLNRSEPAVGRPVVHVARGPRVVERVAHVAPVEPIGVVAVTQAEVLLDVQKAPAHRARAGRARVLGWRIRLAPLQVGLSAEQGDGGVPVS